MSELSQISNLAQAFINYLDCPCEYFASMKDEGPLVKAYDEACIEGKTKGFIPVLVVVDETLWECLILNSDPESDGSREYAFNKEAVLAYRSAMLKESLPDPKEVLANLITICKEDAAEDEFDWDEEIIGSIDKGYENDSFNSLMHYSGNHTHEVILAKIPVKHSYEIFAYLPFGNQNECPDTNVLMSLSKYWYEQHGAQVAALSHDELEFKVKQPLDADHALKTAVELYGFCPDCDQNFDCVGQLADTLTKSTFWYLWWDQPKHHFCLMLNLNRYWVPTPFHTLTGVATRQICYLLCLVRQ